MTNTTSLVEIWPTPTDKAWFGGAGIIGEVWGGMVLIGGRGV